MADYLKKIALPSRAKLYDATSGILDELTLRAMTTKEEKMIYGSTTTEKALEDVLSACIVEPKNFKVDELISPDMTAIMLNLRMLSYGEDYRVSVRCSECGKRNEVDLNLADLPCEYIKDEFEEPILIQLPVCNKILGVKLLRNKDFREIEKWQKRIEKRSPDLKGDIGYILRMAYYIQTIDDAEVSKQEAQGFVESLIGRDSAFFWKEVNGIKMGYDTMITHTCSFCGEEFDFDMPITSEFFRPRA